MLRDICGWLNVNSMRAEKVRGTAGVLSLVGDRSIMYHARFDLQVVGLLGLPGT